MPPILPPRVKVKASSGSGGLSQLLRACDFKSCRPRSSTGQSTGLLILGLQVRVLPGALPLTIPHKQGCTATAASSRVRISVPDPLLGDSG